MVRSGFAWFFLLGGLIFLSGCQPESGAAVQPAEAAAEQSTAGLPPRPTATPTLFPPPTLAIPTPPSPTAAPTSTPTPSPTAAPAPPTATPTATEIPSCADRVFTAGDTLIVVSQTYPLSRSYEPDDLVPLSDYFSADVTLGYPTTVREIIVEPLRALIGDMQAAGLEPQILSGYRSYAQQAIAFEKWLAQFPDRVALLSARPGYSEHQLGTTVDFGSPNLQDYIEEEDLQFHTYFYKTPEGSWLIENAHRYGFTLSYPRHAQELSGFYYEPWHYRYVGIELAAFLKENNLALLEYQLADTPLPCRPEDS